jgi:integral membrane protein
VLFLAYVVIALNIRSDLGWNGRTTFWVLVGAVVPFGSYIVDWRLLRDAGAINPAKQVR